MRAILAIKETEPIAGITPEAVFVHSSPGIVTGIIYGPPRHAILLRKRLWYVWRAIHAWDMTIANTLLPAWNGGFDSLSIPALSDATSTTVDGAVCRIASGGEAWATIRAGNGTHTTTPTYGIMQLLFTVEPSESPTNFTQLNRILMIFTTSSLTGLELTGAWLLLKYQTRYDYNNAAPTVTVYGVTSTTSDTVLSAGDFQTINTTAYSSAYTWASILSAGHIFSFNATGLAAVNKTGLSKFALRYTLDTGDTAPSPIVSTQTTSISFKTSKAALEDWPRLYVTTVSGGGSGGGGIGNVANIFGATAWL